MILDVVAQVEQVARDKSEAVSFQILILCWRLF